MLKATYITTLYSRRILQHYGIFKLSYLVMESISNRESEGVDYVIQTSNQLLTVDYDL